MPGVRVTWREPNGRQWGHPYHPLVELVTKERQFATRAEAEAFADGLRRGGVRDVKVEVSRQ